MLVSGDVFDRPIPPVDALALGLAALLRLAERRPVVVVAGNHDSPELFEALAPLLRDRAGVHLVGIDPAARRRRRARARRARRAGGRRRASRSCGRGASSTSCATPGEWYGEYAERVAPAHRRLQRGAGRPRRRPISCRSSSAHFMVGGVKVDRAAPRGERELHMGDAYAATAQAIPAGPQYVAMGHIHAPQPVPGAPVPAEYAGSLLCARLRRGGRVEARRDRRRRARHGSRRSTSVAARRAGARSIRASGTWERDRGARRRARRRVPRPHGATWAAPTTELGRRAAETFPYLVNVRPRRPEGATTERVDGAARPTDEELYAEFYRRAHRRGSARRSSLALFREVLEEAADATA